MDIHNPIQLALQRSRTGNFQQSERIRIEILEKQPTNEECFYLRGVAYAELEEYELAIQMMLSKPLRAWEVV